MKTKLLTLTLFLICSVSFAQIPSSTWMMIAGICFDNDKSNNFVQTGQNDFVELINTQSTFALKGGVGYAIMENHVAGLKLGYEINKSSDEQLVSFPSDEIETVIFTDTRLVIAPFYRYYYFCAPTLAIIGQLRVPLVFTGGTYEVEGGPNATSQEDPSGFGIGAWVNPKLAWFPKENWSIEAGVGRLGFYTEGYDNDDNNRINESFFSAKLWMFRPSLAVSYYFNRRQNLDIR